MWMANGSNETILANTSNIGIGGLCVHLNQGVDLGTKVDVQLSFTHSSTPLKCHGLVVRSIKENEKFYNIGIQFEPLSELKAAFLDGKIAELIDLEKKGNS
jgi:hypothetical protein